LASEPGKLDFADDGVLGENLRMAAKTKTEPAKLTDVQIEIVGQMNDLSF